MKASLLLTAFLCAMLGGCDKPSAPKPDYRPEEAGTVDHALCLLGFTAVPLTRMATGHQLVQARLNGHDGRFVLDTGANVSVVHAPLAKSFGLSDQTTGVGGAVGFGGALRARQVPIDSLSLGPVKIRQRHIMTADLSQVVDVLSPVAKVRIAGVIGADVLREHRAVIDVARPILYVMRADRDPEPVAPGRCAVPPGKKGAHSVDSRHPG
jgi:hypothetical protein